MVACYIKLHTYITYLYQNIFIISLPLELPSLLNICVEKPPNFVSPPPGVAGSPTAHQHSTHVSLASVVGSKGRRDLLKLSYPLED